MPATDSGLDAGCCNPGMSPTFVMARTLMLIDASGPRGFVLILVWGTSILSSLHSLTFHPTLLPIVYHPPCIPHVAYIPEPSESLKTPPRVVIFQTRSQRKERRNLRISDHPEIPPQVWHDSCYIRYIGYQDSLVDNRRNLFYGGIECRVVRILLPHN